jgi:hypothetical protein
MSALSPASYAASDAARYPSDVDDATWQLIAPTLAQAPGRGRLSGVGLLKASE